MATKKISETVNLADAISYVGKREPLFLCEDSEKPKYVLLRYKDYHRIEEAVNPLANNDQIDEEFGWMTLSDLVDTSEA